MNDRIDEHLRSYYRDLQADPPAALEAQVVRSWRAASAARPARTSWRPAFGLGAATLVVFAVIFTLVARNLGPAATPTPGVSASASASPSAPATASPTASPTPAPTPMPTPTPLPSGLYPTGAMSPALSHPTATRLADGRVLIAGGLFTPKGGHVGTRTTLAEVYDPGTGKFAATGSMADPRAYFTATLLDDGRVLVAGGADLMDGIDNLRTAEIYNPATGKFTRTGPMARGRAMQTAILLLDGRVLIAGGYGGGTDPTARAEVYDPTTGKFAATGSMKVARSGATATLLADGRVLVTGGQTPTGSGVTASAEIYDPATGRFTATASMSTPRYGHSATALSDGGVLVAGGRNASGAALRSAEVFTPSTGRFTATAPMGPAGETLGVLLRDGRALVVAGRSLALYDPATGTFTAGPTLAAAADSATLLANGQVLLTEGGRAQIYQP